MNTEFIDSCLKISIYKKKEGTISSYYFSEGERILPNRLSISKDFEMTKVRRRGRNLLHSVTGQLISTFRKDEVSPLKQFQPFRIRTQLWQHEAFPQFLGYGTCGISGENGKITDKTDTGDLVILYSTDYNWQTIKIFFFQGMGKNPDSLELAMKFASSRI